MRAAKAFYGVALVLFLAVTAWCAADLPPHAASHFGAGGVPDGWSSRGSLCGVMLAIGVLLFGLGPGLSWLTARAPGTINLPTRRQKEYWTSPEHVGTFQRRMQAFLLVLSGLVGLVLAGTEVATVVANHRDPVRAGAEGTWIQGITYLALAAWFVAFVLAVRVPRDADGPHT